jgi:hypothetical protein
LLYQNIFLYLLSNNQRNMKTEQDILIKISELELLIGKAERENRPIDQTIMITSLLNEQIQILKWVIKD